MLLDLVIMECAMDDMTVMIFYFFCAVGTRDIIQSRPLCCHLCASIQVFIRAQCSLVWRIKYIWLSYGVTRRTAILFLKFWLSVHCYVLTEIANWNTGGGDVREVAFYSCRPYFDFIVTIRRWRSVASMWLCFHISNGNTASMVLHLNHSVANLTSIQEAYWFERQNRLYIVIVHYIPFFLIFRMLNLEYLVYTFLYVFFKTISYVLCFPIIINCSSITFYILYLFIFVYSW